MTADLRPWSDLRDSGLLWLINTTVLHPRGYAMGIAELSNANGKYVCLEISYFKGAMA